MRISDENIEQVIFQLKEGLLDKEEISRVEKAIAANKEWQQLADMYDPSLQLPQYPKLVFEGKDKLHAIANPPQKRSIIIPLWSRVAAACIIVVAVVLFIRINSRINTNSNIMVYNKIDKVIDTITSTTQSTSENITVAKNYPLPKTKKSASPTTTTVDIQESTLITKPQETITEEIITYIDIDDTTYDYILKKEPQTTEQQQIAQTIKTPSMSIIYTDKLISFEDETSPDIIVPYAPQPEWRVAIDDWFANLQLARIELQTNAVNSLNRLVAIEQPTK